MSRGLIVLPFLIAALIAAASCNNRASASVQIQQIRSGDYTVTLLSDTARVKQHSNKFTLEIRNAASNDLANVSNVQIQASMRMPGMGPMFGNLSSIRQTSQGHYEFDADFSMAGQWNFLVTFDPNGRVQFNLNPQ